MSTTLVTYQGQLQSTAVHQASGNQVLIDVGPELGGQNSAGSPTDLVAAALGGCLLVTMGLIAKRRDWDIAGATATVEKTMGTTKPLRIASLVTTVRIPQAGRFTIEQRTTLERAAQHCAVHHSLHPDIAAPVTFVWEE